MPPTISRSPASRPASAMAARSARAPRRSASRTVEAVAVARRGGAGGPGGATGLRTTCAGPPAGRASARGRRPRRRKWRPGVGGRVSRQAAAIASSCSSRIAAALVERHAEGVVLLLVPAHRRLDDEPALAEQVERPQLLRQQQRVAQRGDDGRQRDAQARGRRRDRRGSTIESGQGVAGSWLPGAA